MSHRAVGRDSELAQVDAWLGFVPHGAATLLVEGEAGIGKTTVVRAGLERALKRFRVLFSQPTEPEQRLSFTVLGDLLDGVADEVFDDLPDVQRDALEVALLRRAVGDVAPDPRTAGAATLSCLRALASRGPIVMAVEDLQWADRASARALAFALSRLGPEPVGVLLSRRGAGGEALPLELERARHPGGLRRLLVGPLPWEVVGEVVEAHLDWRPSRTMLVRIYEASGGNPLFALELARALRTRRDEVAPGEPLPVPQRLGNLVRGRVRGLAPDHRDVLVHAAALARPSLDVLAAVAGDVGAVMDAVDAAEDAGLVTVSGGRVAFTHPVFSSVLYATARRSRRRAVHRRLADVVGDVEERARHLALAAAGPDAAVAQALEDASGIARARGSSDVAAELAELARQLTPAGNGPAVWRRELLAAQHLVDSQSSDRAYGRLQTLTRLDAPADIRAEACRLLSRIEVRHLGAQAAVARAREGLDIVGEGDSRVRARLLVALSIMLVNSLAGNDLAIRSAEDGVLMAGRLGDRETEALGVLYLLFARVLGGHGLDGEQLTRIPAVDSGAPALFFAGPLLFTAGDHAGARVWLERLRQVQVQTGCDFDYPQTVMFLAHLDWREGNLARSRALAEESMSLSLSGGQKVSASFGASLVAMIAAASGDFLTAYALLDEWRPLADAAGFLPAVGFTRGAAGFVGLCAGDHEATVMALEPLWELAESINFREHPLPFHADLIEALVRAGNLTRAEELISVVEGRTSAFPTLATVLQLRCRELLAAAHGDIDGAVSAGEDAVAVFDLLPMPFEVARSLLVHGTVLRRAKRKRAARAVLEGAAARFRAMGATVWERGALTELERVTVRHSTGAELTPTEQRVAELAAAGRRNQEIATALSIAVRTVEANLTRIYRKLGVEHRAELVRLLTAQHSSPVPSAAATSPAERGNPPGRH